MKNEKIIWSLDLMLNLHNCRSLELDDSFIKNFCQKIGNKIDPKGEIIGIVNNFGDHDENMKGLRVIHETQNCLITGHIVSKNKNFFLNIHSCAGYRPSEIIEIVSKELDPESYSCQKVFRE
jgi:hypothetical protein